MKGATIRDVARRAEVSVASVSRVLSGAGPVTDYTRQKVEIAVAELAYVPHSGARSLSTSRTQVIGVILPDLFGEFFSELIRGMDLAARAGGYHLIVSSSHGDADEASAAIRSMRGRVDGLAVLSPHVDAAGLADSLAGSLPVLLMNGAAEGTGRPSIVVDNHGGAVAAVRHLAEAGRRRIAFIAGPPDNGEAAARRAGYMQAMAEAGLAPQVAEGDFSQGTGHAACLDLVGRAPRPDAVFAANDMMAVGALLALQETGLRCPEDVAVVGFDDVPIAALMRPSLTTLKIDIAEIGRRALERLIGMIARPAEADAAQEVVRPVLVERQSSRAHARPNPAAAGQSERATIDS